MTTESRQKTDYSVLHRYQPFYRTGRTDAPRKIYTSSEVISGYRGPRQPGIGHPCTHTKISFVPAPLAYTEGNTVSQQTVVTGLPTISAAYVDSVTAYGSADVTARLTPSDARALLDELCGEIPPVVSVPNLILELPQTLNLWHDLKGPLLELFSKPGVRQKWRSGSSALLSQQFGFFPLIGDIQKLVTSKRTVHQQLQAILKSQAQKNLRKVVRSTGASGSIYFHQVGFNFRPSGQPVVDARASIHARTKITRYLDASDPNVVSAMANALYGWNRPLGTLWEATPFSFVLDWFVPVGQYLSGLEKSIFGSRMSIESLCWTAHATATQGCCCAYTQWGTERTVPCGQLVARSFARGSGLPVSTRWDDLTIPNVKQAILGGALVLQK